MAFSTPLRAWPGLALLAWLLTVPTVVTPAGAGEPLRIGEADVTNYLGVQPAVAQWQADWLQRLGEPKPSDMHPLEALVDAGADAASLDQIIAGSGLSTRQAYIGTERLLSDIYLLLYGDTSGLASMAVAIEITIKGAHVTQRDRAQMIRRERLLIEQERRASVAPETIEIIGRHSLALARTLGDIK